MIPQNSEKINGFIFKFFGGTLFVGFTAEIIRGRAAFCLSESYVGKFFDAYRNLERF